MRRKVPLGDLFRVGSSKRVLQSQWKSVGVPFFRGREITRLATEGFVDNELFISEDLYAAFAAKYGVPSAGDIMITAIGTIGNSYIVRDADRFYFKDASVLWLKKTAEVSSDFVNLWLKSPLFFDQLDKGNGATVDTLTIQKLQSVVIDLPPLEEQLQIVGILDEAFDGIATAKANAEKNLQNVRALFESHLQAVFTQRGDGWTETTLEGVAHRECTLSYGIVQPGEEVADGLAIVRPTDMTSKVIYLDGLKRIDPKLADSYKRTTLVGGELLLCVRGSTGMLSIAAPELAGGNVTRGIVPIRFDPALMTLDFGFYLMNSDVVQEQIREKTYGTALMQINIRDLRSISFSIPPLKKQEAIATALHELSEETQRLESLYQQKLAALDELKKSLLHQAFSGAL